MDIINGTKTNASLSNEITAHETENRKVAYEAALEGIVLLKNDGVMPLKPGKIALFGAGAEKTIKGGTGSGEVNERYSVNIRQGLENAGFTVTTKKWLEDYTFDFKRAEDEFGKEVARQFRKLGPDFLINIMEVQLKYPFGRIINDLDIEESGADTCVYVIARQSGEGADRSIDKHDYGLSEIERANIEIVARAYKKTIIVINAGSSFDCGFIDEIDGINALVFFCQQGCEGGNAFADILCGKSYPSGHLSDSWAKDYSDIPFGEEYAYINGNIDNEYYKEGIFVGYRYFDNFDVKPMFPFGYGLGYARFEIGDTSIEKAEKGRVNISATMVNTSGEYRGKEAVQAYVSPPQGALVRERRLLAAFAKTRELNPGEATTISLKVDFSLLGAFDEQTACTVLEKGEYPISIGFSSADTKVIGCVTISETIILSKHCHICSPNSEIHGIALRRDHAKPFDTATEIILGKSDFETKIHEYGKESSIDPKVQKFIDGLSADELIDSVVGGGLTPKKNAFQAPGASGSTTARFVDRSIGNLVVTDGPAGLRLMRRSAITKSGKVKMLDAQMPFLEYMPKLIKKGMFGNEKKDKHIYQYCTAFPIGNALAQTWNTELIERVGDSIGREMEEYGVTFWLAPGMNIHRNPLCGRNYEYFSEDPLLSGKVAAAMTRGVQKHKGRYVTLKHYACNNQETNRNKTSANLSEKALREIYLKGFEIAVKEGKPGAVMTSYNKVNGIYTSNSDDLCTKALRDEWGFDGLVMTDWFSNGKGLGDSALSIKSGNDLLMPGTKANRKSIKKALRQGDITLRDIKRCAGNVLKYAVK